MKRWILIDEALTPDGQRLTLNERDGDRSIRIGGAELMNTRERASEELLGTLTCAPLARKPEAQVLIGGLGLGFTLRAVLATVRQDARVHVVELMPAIVRWNTLPDDPRLRITEADVIAMIAKARVEYDAILLDIDNGPAALTTAGNGKMYRTAGLEQAHHALRPGGVLAIWSVDDDPGFGRRLERSGFIVEVKRTRARAGGGGHRTIFLARKS